MVVTQVGRICKINRMYGLFTKHTFGLQILEFIGRRENRMLSPAMVFGWKQWSFDEKSKNPSCPIKSTLMVAMGYLKRAHSANRYWILHHTDYLKYFPPFDSLWKQFFSLLFVLGSVHPCGSNILQYAVILWTIFQPYIYDIHIWHFQ